MTTTGKVIGLEKAQGLPGGTECRYLNQKKDQKTGEMRTENPKDKKVADAQGLKSRLNDQKDRCCGN